MGLGFYQDDINMIGQCYKNLEKGTSRVMKKVTETEQKLPALIIGSGPSLTGLLPFIKENQDRVILFE